MGSVAGEQDLAHEQDLSRQVMDPSDPERPSPEEGGRGGFAGLSSDPAGLDLTVAPEIADRTLRIEPLDEAAQALLWFG